MGATPWRFESSREHYFLPGGVLLNKMASTDSANVTGRDQDPHFVKEAFSSIAPRYVLTNHVLSMGIDVIWRKRVASIVAQRSPDFVLDVATGSGDLAAEVLKKCPGSRVVGVDFCAPMLNHARKRGLPELMVADGMNLPFEDSTVDVVTISYGLRNMESWGGAVREFSRVLKPDGALVILDFSIPDNPILRVPYRFYLHHVLPLVAGILTGNCAAYRYLGESIERFPKGQQMVDLLTQNGFGSAVCQPIAGGISSVYVAEKRPSLEERPSG